MPHPLDRDDRHRIVDRVNDPVIADAHAKGVVAAVEFAAARRPGISGEAFGSAQDASLNYGISRPKSFVADRRNSTA